MSKYPQNGSIDLISDMTTGTHARRAFQALLMSSLGLLVSELLRPVEAQAESCTLDPLGGEVCLPEQDPDDDEDGERDVSKKSKGTKKQSPVVIIPLCFGPCTQFPPATPYRQFAEEPEAESTPVPMQEPAVEPAPAEPIGPLWMKSDSLDPAVAEA